MNKKAKLFSTVVFGSILLLTGSVASAADTKPSLDTSSPCPPPEYPRASLANEEQGTVVLGLLVGVDGKVADSKVEKSSGFPKLDKAAQATFSKCKFKPGTKDGKPDQVWMTMQFEWKIS